MSPQEVRETIHRRIFSIEAPIPPIFSVTDRTLTHSHRKTPIRIYTPSAGDSFPVTLLIHGGAWVAGNLDTHDNLARYLASQTHGIVVSVGYTHSPEGKFPLPLEQCYDTLTWITEHRAELGADTTKIAVIGDSAGGNMAAALCLMARDRLGPAITFQVLINPAPDLTCQGTLLRQNDPLDMLRWQAIQYLSDPNDRSHPYASPLVATDLSGLPPALVILTEKDELREDGQRYADRLQMADVPTSVYCQQGIGHLAGHAARASAQAQPSLEVAAKALQHAFNPRTIK